MNLENNSKWLFKYMPFNLNAVKILVNNQLWFGTANKLNDPNELEFIVKYNEEIQGCNFNINIPENLYELGIQTEFGKKQPTGFEREKYEKELKKVIRGCVGICSMSSIFDDILMWAHYADNNKGICIVFDKECLEKTFSEGRKVDYSKEIPKAMFVSDKTLGKLVTDNLFYMNKLSMWDYEEEYRFVCRYKELVSYDDTQRLKSFPEEAIVGVLLGENFPKEGFKTLINLLLIRNPNKKVHFWKCEKNIHQNSMGVTRISEKTNIYRNNIDYPFENILSGTLNELGKA